MSAAEAATATGDPRRALANATKGIFSAVALAGHGRELTLFTDPVRVLSWFVVILADRIREK